MRLFPSTGRELAFFALRAAVFFALVALAGGCMMWMPGTSHRGPLPPLDADGELLRDRLYRHVKVLAGEIGERNLERPASLDRAREYVTAAFRESGLPVREEPYRSEGREVANIEAELKGRVHPEEIVVVGAHYDSPPGSPGADDNASGVAALLELARLFRDRTPERTVRFVAFVNEEPPYFRTEAMGSLVYARGCRSRGEKVVAMLSLESIGFYSEAPGSQSYPPPFGLAFPDTGDFVGFVGELSARPPLRRSIGVFRETTPFPSEGVAAPGWIMGIGWSDHWSFGQTGYPAIMVTDTAPFRNPHYHEPDDVPATLDYGRLARVAAGVGRVVEELAKGELRDRPGEPAGGRGH